MADTGYCGLSNALAREIEKHWQQDNDVFAQQVWQKPWKEVFPEDVDHEFTPNDFDIAQPDERTQKQRHQTARNILASVEDIIAEPVARDHLNAVVR